MRNVLPFTRRVRNRAFRPGSGVGYCMRRIEGAAGKPRVVLSEARPKLLGHLFRVRMPRVCDNAMRVGSIIHRTNSHTGVTMCTVSPGISPMNTYIKPGKRHMRGVIGRLRSRGVSVIQ